jgi:type IV pilus assembly protein PilB
MAHDSGRESGWLKEEYMGEDEARKEFAYKNGIPFVMLSRDDIELSALTLIPEPISRAHNIIAYRQDEHGIEVALLNIDDLDSIDFLKRTYRIKPRLTNRESMKRALLLYQKQVKEKFAGLVERGIEAVDNLIRHALAHHATHIHIEPSTAAMLIRYRINGVLREAMRLPEHANEFITKRLKSLAKLFPVAAAQEGRFKFEHEGEQYSVRVSTVPSIAGEKMLLRLTRESYGQKGFTLSSLGFHGEGLERLHKLLHERTGLVAVCGPRESGVTTTLYTMLDELNHPGVAVSTIEEKVEYSLPHVSQTETRSDVGLDLLAGLRAVLRADPDVVMVSSISKEEVAELASQAARRGVFVLAGLEVSSIEKAIKLFEDIEPRAVINQRLVRRLCDECKKNYRATREDLEQFESIANFGRVLAALKDEDVVGEYKAWKDLDFYKPGGCAQCDQGYKGRLGVQEVADESGEGLNLIEDALFKAAQGLTSLDEVVYLAP